jgi:hypothetical protein
MFNSLVEESFGLLSVSSREFHTAARFADQHATGLRSGDALHLAVATNHGAHLRTLDQGLAETGQTLGASVSLLYLTLSPEPSAQFLPYGAPEG